MLGDDSRGREGNGRSHSSAAVWPVLSMPSLEQLHPFFFSFLFFFQFLYKNLHYFYITFTHVALLSKVMQDVYSLSLSLWYQRRQMGGTNRRSKQATLT